MFFRVSNKKLENKWPLSVDHVIKNYWLELDQGWKYIDCIFYKGYSIGKNLQQKIDSRDFTECAGNYVILDFSNDDAQIYYDNSRAFPLYYNENVLTNLQEDNLTPVWYDGGIRSKNQKWYFFHRPENTIVFDSQHRLLNKSDLADLVCDYIVESAKQLDVNLPVLAADSRGVDSTLIRSAFDYCGIKYSLVQKHSTALKPLGWGYKQIYTGDVPHMQVTGFCGDELLLRSPLYCQWLLDAYNIDLIQEFDLVDHSYMKGFFNQNYRQKLKTRTEVFRNQSEGYNHTINVAINDFQMWHIDNIITFTPLRNRHIATECMYADADAILDQVIHAGISKEIIKRLNPKNLKSISKHKNNYE